MAHDLTTNRIGRTVLRFCLPYLLANCLQSLYGIVDLFVIGQFENSAATTAVSVGSQVMHILTVILGGFAMGCTVRIGHAYGERYPRRLKQAIGNSIFLFAVLSVALTVLLFFLVDPILALMSTPQESFEDTRRYLQVCFLGLPMIVGYNLVGSILRGLGDSNRPLYFIAIACGANVLLDFLFIGLWGWSAFGAALATILAQMLSFAVSLAVLRKKGVGVGFTFSDLRPNLPMLKRILSVGFPIAVQDGFVQTSFLLITILANEKGVQTAAAVGIVERIIGFVFLVPSAMLSTVSAVGSQNIGAGLLQRAKQTLGMCLLISVSFGTVFCALSQCFATTFLSWFTDDAAVISLGAGYLRTYSLDCIMASVQFCFSGYFFALGRSFASFLHNAISITLVRIPGAIFAFRTFSNSLQGLGLAAPMGSALSALLCVILYLRFEHKRKLAPLS